MSKQTATPNSKKALLDAFDEVIKTQVEQRAERDTKPATAGRPAVVTSLALAILVCIGGYVWLEQPDWLVPASRPLESAAVKEASLRIALANTARHIEYFRQRHGRLPATLEETGLLTSGIAYELAGDGYRLRGVNGQTRLTLRSTDVLSAFVGNSFEIISRRSR